MMTLSFVRTFNRLSWGPDTYDAISGPWGQGLLPEGEYTVKIYNVVSNSSLSSAYRDSFTNERWFIPLEPKFATPRQGLGIHADGNVPGTQGCVGLRGQDASRFWTKWQSTPMGSRPTSLTVT